VIWIEKLAYGRRVPTLGPPWGYLTEQGLSDLGDSQLVLPSIGSERKANFPIRHKFFDPGACSRSGWAASS